MAVEIGVLGPMAARVAGEPVDLGPPQQQAVLALLCVRPGEVVDGARLVDALWPTGPPATAAKVVQTYVSRLRRLLGHETVVRAGGGYFLNTSAAAVDAGLFSSRIANEQYDAAMTLWRGSPYAGLREIDEIAAEARRLEELYLYALERSLDTEIAAGRAQGAVGELTALIAAHPLHEGFAARLMLALYASGRQSDALSIYREVRDRLVSDVGVEPSAALRGVHRRILEHDPTLPRARALTKPRVIAAAVAAHGGQRKALALAAIAAVAATFAVVFAVAVVGDEGEPVVIRPNSIVRIDAATNRVAGAITVGRHPGPIAVSGDVIWVANIADRTLARVDTRTERVTTVGGAARVEQVATDERGNVYVAGFDDPYVWRLDGRTLRPVERYRVRSRAVAVAAGGGSLWVVDRLVDSVSQINLATGNEEAAFEVGRDPLAAEFAYGAVWISNSDDATVSVIRPGVDRVTTIRVDSRPMYIASGEGSIWVAGMRNSTVTRIDADTHRVVATIDAAESKAFPSGIYTVAVGAGGVWAANWHEFTVVRIDPDTNRVVARIKLPAAPRDLAVVGGDVWVSVVNPTSG